MADYQTQTLADGSRQLLTQLRGRDILDNRVLNKGSAFTISEREALGLTGLLPAQVLDLETHVERVSGHLARITDPLTAYTLMLNLRAENRTAFYATLISDLDRFMPIVYTPTVGIACEQSGSLIRRANGLTIPITYQHRMREIFANWPESDVRFCVVTDGSRILGLGDLGANGMGIPVGKLSLYTAVAGVPPELTIPITLDVGTDNPVLLSDPFYPGLRQPRATGQEYEDFIEEFVTAFSETYPNACIQWEDFSFRHAEPILAKYKDRVCSFNDDIQGTASVAVAGLYAACRAKGETMRDQRILFLGAGSAATGIADLFTLAVQAEGATVEESLAAVRMFDMAGLLVTSRTDLAPFQQRFAVDGPRVHSFLQTIEDFQPTAIIGVSTVGGAFSDDILKAMARLNERPIIFPYSNPTSHSETTAALAYEATDNRVLFAGGSPFPPVVVDERVVQPAQGNNVYIFPALGLAIFASGAKRVTEEMFLVAAQALAAQVSGEELEAGLMYPPRPRIAEVSSAIAVAVAEYIFDNGLAEFERPEDLAAYVERIRYIPEYLPVLPI